MSEVNGNVYELKTTRRTETSTALNIYEMQTLMNSFKVKSPNKYFSYTLGAFLRGNDVVFIESVIFLIGIGLTIHGIKRRR